MQFQLNVTLTEDDYLAFNIFHLINSAPGRKQAKNSRVFLTICTAALMAFTLLLLGWTTFAIFVVMLLGLIFAFGMLFLKKLAKISIKTHIKKLKKTGKLPFDTTAKLEFYDNMLVEITAGKRTEQSYEDLERICIIENQFIYLYQSSISAYIFPIPQLREQLNQTDFINFLIQKCPCVEYY